MNAPAERALRMLAVTLANPTRNFKDTQDRIAGAARRLVRALPNDSLDDAISDLCAAAASYSGPSANGIHSELKRQRLLIAARRYAELLSQDGCQEDEKPLP